MDQETRIGLPDDEAWRSISDVKQRKRIQNRLSQRRHRAQERAATTNVSQRQQHHYQDQLSLVQVPYPHRMLDQGDNSFPVEIESSGELLDHQHQSQHFFYNDDLLCHEQDEAPLGRLSLASTPSMSTSTPSMIWDNTALDMSDLARISGPIEQTPWPVAKLQTQPEGQEAQPGLESLVANLRKAADALSYHQSLSFSTPQQSPLLVPTLSPYSSTACHRCQADCVKGMPLTQTQYRSRSSHADQNTHRPFPNPHTWLEQDRSTALSPAGNMGDLLEGIETVQAALQSFAVALQQHQQQYQQCTCGARQVR